MPHSLLTEADLGVLLLGRPPGGRKAAQEKPFLQQGVPGLPGLQSRVRENGLNRMTVPEASYSQRDTNSSADQFCFLIQLYTLHIPKQQICPVTI